MANEQFIRKVVVDIIPTSGKGVSVTDLRIGFKCVKTNESTPNSAVVDIYNLSPNTRNLLSARNTVLSLTVGYLGLTASGNINQSVAGNPGIGTIFIGNITKVKHDKKKKHDLDVTNKIENTDLITTVDVGDGDNQYRNAYLDKGYPPNTPLSTVVPDLVNAMGLNVGAQFDLPKTSYTQGFAVTGLCRDNLNQICDTNDLEWSIQNQAVQIVSKTGTAKVATIVINAETGMIGIPTLTDFGVRVRTLCDHRLIPGRGVQITSQYLNNNQPQNYKVRKVTHHGDNWTGDYFSDVEATTPVVYS